MLLRPVVEIGWIRMDWSHGVRLGSSQTKPGRITECSDALPTVPRKGILGNPDREVV